MNTGMVSLPLLQDVFPTQELNQGLLHCRWILFHWATREAPNSVYRILNDTLIPSPVLVDRIAYNQALNPGLEREERKREERGVEGKGPEEMRKSWEVCFSREIFRNCRAYWWFPSRESFSILAFQKPTTRWPAATPSLCSHSNQSFQWPPINIEPPPVHIFVLPSHMWTTTKVPQILGKACNMKESPRKLDPHPSQPEVRR